MPKIKPLECKSILSTNRFSTFASNKTKRLRDTESTFWVDEVVIRSFLKLLSDEKPPLEDLPTKNLCHQLLKLKYPLLATEVKSMRNLINEYMLLYSGGLLRDTWAYENLCFLKGLKLGISRSPKKAGFSH